MILLILVSRGCHNMYYKLGSLTYRNVLSHSSEDQKSEIKVYLGPLTFSEVNREGPAPGLSSRFW